MERIIIQGQAYQFVFDYGVIAEAERILKRPWPEIIDHLISDYVEDHLGVCFAGIKDQLPRDPFGNPVPATHIQLGRMITRDERAAMAVAILNEFNTAFPLPKAEDTSAEKNAESPGTGDGSSSSPTATSASAILEPSGDSAP
jgi:hypothetical protein